MQLIVQYLLKLRSILNQASSLIGSLFGKVLNVLLSVCFIGLLINVSIPSLHEKVHELEGDLVFGQEDHEHDDGGEHPENHSSGQDHSDTCHVCKVISHFSPDVPIGQSYLNPVNTPQL